MEIKYLTLLDNYPTVKNKETSYIYQLESTSMEEIVSLENTYNEGMPFPRALRELLFLAGGDCYVLDYGLNDSQTELQQTARSNLTRHGRNLNIPRRFYVIDTYNVGSQFLFLYLDEGVDDPIVHEAVFEGDDRGWLHSLKKPLSAYINDTMAVFLSGENPF